MNRMRAKPGKKEVEEGIEELKTVLAADGNWARDTGTKKTPLDAYGHVALRMKELVDESDWPAMERKSRHSANSDSQRQKANQNKWWRWLKWWTNSSQKNHTS